VVTANLATASLKATGASASRTFGARFADCVSVKDFGATGDNSTNDGPALQAALTFLRKTSSPSSRALYIPPGNYITNQVLNITNTEGVRIFGDGSVATVIKYRGSATAGNSEGSTANALAITPVIMTNGFSYSSLSGIHLNSIPGANTVGIYFYQDNTHSKGNTDQLNISDLLVDGPCATGYLIGYEATALVSEIMFHNCVVNGATAYGFRNVSTNALNNNLYNCGGVGNAVWASCPTGSMNVYGASLAQNTLDIQAGQMPMAVVGCRTESLAFVDAGSAGQTYVTIIGCGQIPGNSTNPASFVNVQNSQAMLIGNYIGSNIATQGKILGSAYVSMIGNYFGNTAPFSGFTGEVRHYDNPQFAGTVATLPAASAPFKGVRLFVKDATAAASTSNFSSTVTGGGANTVPVWCDGAAWRIG